MTDDKYLAKKKKIYQSFNIVNQENMKTSSIMITCTSDKLQLIVLQDDLFVPTGMWEFVCTVLQQQSGKSLA